MGGGGAEEERVVPCLDLFPCHRRHEMASLPIPDELLPDILLRLPTPADLARASAACVSFRRVATHRSLLRRYRKLHAPPLLGFLDRDKVFYPATTRYTSPSAAVAVDLAADFSCSFLPAPASDWVVQDVCDGRVLLDRPMRAHNSTVVLPEAVVCDPLHRRYRLIPPITCDLAAASFEDPIWTRKLPLRGEIFLDPTGAGEEAVAEDETSFRVIWMAQCITKVVAFVFSSNTGQWRALASRRWSDLFGTPQLIRPLFLKSRHYVYGCFYWFTAHGQGSKLLVLDTREMEFSLAQPPPETGTNCNFAMVEAGEGRPGVFVLENTVSDLSYFIRHNDGVCQWIKVKTISLDSWAYFICGMEKYLLLYQGKTSLLDPGCFRLEINTFKLEKVCSLVSTFNMHAYCNFPPSLLSSPTI